MHAHEPDEPAEPDEPDDLPLITHHDHVTTVWRELLDGYEPTSTALFVLLVDPWGRVELSTVFDEAPAWPDLESLEILLGGIVDAAPDDTAALLIARPGPPEETDDDRAWAMAIDEVAGQRGLEVWVTHRATRLGVDPIIPDGRGLA